MSEGEQPLLEEQTPPDGETMLEGRAQHEKPQHEKPLAPGLYLVATPIGNLEDISLRALRVLRSADRIACEDTRQTGKLLGHFGIRTPTVSYHAHNEKSRAGELLGALEGRGPDRRGQRCGHAWHCGPRGRGRRGSHRGGHCGIPIPGANAALSALVASGLDARHFSFHGFLPSKQGARRSALEAIRDGECDDNVTHIFYETPHRIVEALNDVVSVFGPQQRVALARELTKLHEEFLRGTAASLHAELSGRPSVRGEMVLLLQRSAGAGPPVAEAPRTLAEDVKGLIEGKGLTEMDAVKQVAKARGLGKSEAYREWQRSQVRKRER